MKRSWTCLLLLAGCFQTDVPADYPAYEPEPIDPAFLLDGSAEEAKDAAASGMSDASVPPPPPPRDASTPGNSEDASIPPPPPPPSAVGTLSFEVSTAPVGGKYAPKNIGAIWVETQQGKFVKTLERWAQTRKKYLQRFLSATGDNTTDAITSATLSQHKKHTVTWDLTDTNRKPVPNGDYRLVLELTDRNSAGASHEVPFTVAADAVTLMPEGTPQFKQMLLRLEQ